MTLSQQFSEFVVLLKFQDLPALAVTHAKGLVLDHIGVAAFGATTSWGKAVAETIGRLGGVEESSYYFAGRKTSISHAAFVNGTFAHAFELDDSFGGVHPGSCIIPAAIAAGERENADGRALITGVVAGYEILGRLSEAMRHISVRGHHPTGTIGPFGAAVAAGKVIGLNVPDMVSALGLAGNFPTGVCEFYRGTMEKRVFAGRASESGILAALLAQAGVTGASTIFEGEFGFCRVFSEAPKLEKLTEALGTEFYTGRPYVKRYASAGTTHPFIDAALTLHEQHKQALADSASVAEIRIEGPELMLNRRRSETKITDVMAAQYSIPYVVSSALFRGRPGIRDFSDKGIENPGVQRLLTRCTAVPHREYAGMGKITVRFQHGGDVSADITNTNLPIAQVAPQEITKKFYDVASVLFGQTEPLEKVFKAIDTLENMTNVRALTELMTVES
jgi:2-methylcitrate dehydratase PrpD